LLAEDNPINQKVVVRMLEKFGCRCDAVGNGTEAVAMFSQAPYDVILMDCQMPVMDGFEATRAIRALEKNRQKTPIVALTANALPGDRERCLKAGMNDYLPKPIIREDLLDVLIRWTAPDTRRTRSTKAAATRRGQKPVFDPKRLKEISDGDAKFLKQLLAGFVRDTESRIQDLRAMIEKKDAKAIRSVSHAIKGAASNVGALGMSRLAKHIVGLSDTRDIPAMKAELRKMGAEMQKIRKFVSEEAIL
ncbi:MAG: response regulator, partial [bacterium]